MSISKALRESKGSNSSVTHAWQASEFTIFGGRNIREAGAFTVCENGKVKYANVKFYEAK